MMMSCKDCIYRAMCYNHEHYGRDDEKPCEMFRNEADFVEVVRCKDCKRFMEYAEDKNVEGASGTCYLRMMYSLEEQFYSVKYDDFCSCGERRKDNG